MEEMKRREGNMGLGNEDMRDEMERWKIKIDLNVGDIKYIHTYIHTYIHPYTYIHIHTYIHILCINTLLLPVKHSTQPFLSTLLILLCLKLQKQHTPEKGKKHQF